MSRMDLHELGDVESCDIKVHGGGSEGWHALLCTLLVIGRGNDPKNFHSYCSVCISTTVVALLQ